MASPFYLFRKYQKAFLVVAGVLAMFIFVVADPLMTWLQSSAGGGRSAKTVVTAWDGGSLNLQQLDSLYRRRVNISEFLNGLITQAATQVEQEGGSPQLPNLPDFRLQDYNPRNVQLGCINTRLLAEMAKDSGFSVSDEVVNNYLVEWGLRRMGDGQIGQLMSRVGLTDKVLFAGLRELLMGNHYINSYSMAMGGVMPEERWQDWKRINERIAVAAAIVPAEKFLSQVPDPSDTELKQFYELHKERIDGTQHLVMNARLPSPDPGFREPRRVKLQYLVGNIDDWAVRMNASVTDAEIAEYYEQNKSTQFVSTSSSTSAEGLFDDDEEEDVSDETDDDAPADDAPAVEAAEAPADDESGQALRKSPFQLVAFQDDAEADTEEADGETASEDEEDSETQKTEEAKTEETTTEEATTSAPESEPPVKYAPLDEVRDQIRRELAKSKATVAMQKAIRQVYAGLQSTYSPYGFEVVSARTEDREIPAPPASLTDYSELARQANLAFEATVLLSDQGVVGTNVGKAVDAQTGRNRVVNRLFTDLELFEPLLAKDYVPAQYESILGRDSSWYIVCKTEDVASSVPEFEDIRESVLAAWKKQEAGKLALAKAEELAKQATESGDTVATVARGAGFESRTTDMFSWLTFGAAQSNARLGDAPPLEAIDADFMTTAFDLEADQRVALLNHNHTNAYIIQLDRREQTKDELRQQFLAEANSWHGTRAMNSARFGNAQSQIVSQLMTQAGLDRDQLEKFFVEESR